MSTVITKEDIELMKKDKETFQKCSAALETYAAAKDDESKKKAAIEVLQNYAPEKTLYILKTDERLEPIRKKIEEGGKLGEMKDLKTFIQLAKELAPGELDTLMSETSAQQSPTGQTGTPESTDAQSGDQPKDSQAENSTNPQNDTESSNSTSQAPAESSEGAPTTAPTQPENDASNNGDKKEDEEDPWIRSTLSKLRSKNLY